MNLRLARIIDRRLGIPLCRVLASIVRIGGRRPSGRDPQRILVIRNFGVGNLALMLPTITALRARFPAARIDAITLAQNRGFLERTGVFTTVWYLRSGSILAFCRSFLSSVRPLLATRYELLIDFEQFARASAVMGLVLMIPRRVGFDTPGQGRRQALTDAVPYPETQHMMDGFHSLLEPLGVAPAAGLTPVGVPTTEAEDRAVDTLLREGGLRRGDRIAVLHPGTGPNFVLRRWPEDRFAAVADFLVDSGFHVVLTGISAEADIVGRVEAAMKRRAVNTVGRLSMGELLALLRRASLVISNDTGPTHLAAAQGAPVFGLFGPNTPALYGPRGPHDQAFYLALPCSPCITNTNEKGSDCRDNLCMRLMSADQVIESLSRMFVEGNPYGPVATGGVRQAADGASVHPLLLVRAGASRIAQ